MIAVTLLARDEIDIIGQWLDHHIPLVDRLYITDNGSVDGTRETLADYAARFAQITVIDEPGLGFWQNKWVDRMIRTAIADGADWVANSDADEFWDVDFRKLAVLDARCAAWRVKSFLFVPTCRDDLQITDPVKRLRWWVKSPRNETERWCMPTWHKIFHQTKNFRANVQGNHDVEFNGKTKTKDAPGNCRIRHYPNRSWQQYRRKYIQGGEAYSHTKIDKAYGFHWRERYKIYCEQSITGLKRLWYQELADDFSQLEQVND